MNDSLLSNEKFWNCNAWVKFLPARDGKGDSGQSQQRYRLRKSRWLHFNDWTRFSVSQLQHELERMFLVFHESI